MSDDVGGSCSPPSVKRRRRPEVAALSAGDVVIARREALFHRGSGLCFAVAVRVESGTVELAHVRLRSDWSADRIHLLAE